MIFTWPLYDRFKFSFLVTDMYNEKYITFLNVWLEEYLNLTGKYSYCILFISYPINHWSKSIFFVAYISWNYRSAHRRIFSKAEQQFYGAFVEIQLVENETCNLSPNSVIGDTCSKYDPFLTRVIRVSHFANSYRRQNENQFTFNNPTCNRRC